MEEAARDLEAVLKEKPDHPAAPLLLADCRLQLGEWKQVMAILDPLLEKDPENQAILYVIGTALMRDRQTERGQRVLDRILRKGGSADAHLVLAIASREANDDIAAEKELRRALELDPRLPPANGVIGDVLTRMGEGSQAMMHLQREIELNPNHFESHLLLGLLLRQEERNDEASDRYHAPMKISAQQLSVVVLASGSGTDLQIIIDASEQGMIDAKVVVVISDNNEAYALSRAKKHGIPCFCVDPKGTRTVLFMRLRLIPSSARIRWSLWSVQDTCACSHRRL